MCVLHIGVCVTYSSSLFFSPALLQSTLNTFFCPTRALVSPPPRHTTLLASEVSFDEVLYAPATLDVLVIVCTRTEDVS